MVALFALTGTTALSHSASLAEVALEAKFVMRYAKIKPKAKLARLMFR